MKPVKRLFQSVTRRAWVWAFILCAPLALGAAESGKTFASPEDAAAALGAAAAARDTNALRLIFGPAAEDLENPDRVQADNDLREFVSAFNQNNRVVRESETKYVLEIGADQWPFPVPLVRREGGWVFDTASGREELVNRRIGRNELAVLEVLRACVTGQREYASRDRDGDEVLEYASRLASSPGSKDGLYWPADLDGEISPLGPLVASAQSEGYRLQSKAEPATHEPFHGYYFKILTRQGKHAPGGKYDYIINGNMIGGFAFLAWPAARGDSGVMTFIVNHQGRVYQRDLGANTAKAARKMTAYDPDPSWQVSPQ